MHDATALEDLTSAEERRCVPVWVPDPSDPDGLEGAWQIVDPGSPQVDRRLAAQARAVARLWRRAVLRDVA